MILHNTAAALLQLSCELRPNLLISRQPQSFSRLLHHCTAKHFLLMLTHEQTDTGLYCLLRDVRYLFRHRPTGDLHIKKKLPLNFFSIFAHWHQFQNGIIQRCFLYLSSSSRRNSISTAFALCGGRLRWQGSFPLLLYNKSVQHNTWRRGPQAAGIPSRHLPSYFVMTALPSR